LARNILYFVVIAVISIGIVAALPEMGSTDKTNAPHPLMGETFNDGITVEDVDISLPKYQTLAKTTAFRAEDFRVMPGSTVFDTLVSVGVTPPDILNIISAAKPIKNLASIAAKTMISVSWEKEEDKDPSRVEFVLSPTKSLVLEKDQETNWDASVEEAEIEIIPTSFSGLVTSSLWDSASAVGMDSSVINRMAEVFAWQVDFNREVQQGDRWRLVAERHYAKGKPVGWGEIIVAEYENVGVVTTAIRFKHNGLKKQYFGKDGNSLRRLFLKSPLRFGRVTSRFGVRFHPILKVNKKHMGVDYGAPRGTPIMAVGNGVVIQAARRGASGNTVKIRHNSTYQTAYRHLSKFGKGIKRGTKIEMGQVIGYVGATGRATGPHLHFEFYKDGRFVDPLGLKFPSADPVPEKLMEEFEALAAKSLAMLPDWDSILDQSVIATSVEESQSGPIEIVR